MSADQDQRIRNILARLEVTSNGPISSYTPVASKGAFGSGEPTTGDAWPPHVRWASKYNEAKDDFEREKVIGKATRELEEITRRVLARVDGESVELRNRRMVRDYAGWTAQEVATAFRCGVREVHAVRLAADRDKDFGRRVEGGKDDDKLPPAERRCRVDEMKAQGMTVRQIAFRLGVAPQTVSNDLARGRRDAA